MEKKTIKMLSVLQWERLLAGLFRRSWTCML